ncbi:hypothetical protein OH76DRAFT_341288 [Lentinus brumalis]|uniref:Methyltransferase domain-containing protein n=1 Tax=Lentinus brumalis TaxID=2498619 RepID=A0A371DEN6_9APHY|nr:hypothetical protein OH76DRAFT_341288 [Polyporus brumalis]
MTTTCLRLRPYRYPSYVGHHSTRVPRTLGRERFPPIVAHIHHLPFPEEPMPPDYELQSYWNARFENEHHFEWLGDGSDTILPYVRSYLSKSRASGQSSPSHPSRLLHIGAGTSSLAERIRELYKDTYGHEANEEAIVHTDFAENLVARMQERESSLAKGSPGKGMLWLCVDIMQWGDVQGALASGGEDAQGVFDVVVDKSTSDAISCREDAVLTSKDRCLHPAFNEYLAAHKGQTINLAPVEILAVHLASLVHPGGLWVALTFSSNRFAFLSSPEATNPTMSPRASQYWLVEDIKTIDAPTGMEGSGYAPVVQHYVFLLRRKDSR